MSDLVVVRPQETLLCPRGSGVGDPILIDLRAIMKTMNRIIEVQAVTPQKAPELLTSFNISWRDLHQHITFLAKELIDAERAVNRVRATILLDEVAEVLKKKNLKDNEHNREAVIALDTRYDEAASRYDEINAIVEGMKGMLKATEMAYNSVKKLLGEQAYNYLNRPTDVHATDGTEVGETSPYERPSQGSLSGFGSPKY